MDPTLASRHHIEVLGGALHVVGGNGPTATLHIGGQARVIGRGAGCDLVLADKKVSSAHLELVATERGVRVRDLGSRNGTFLGPLRIAPEGYLSGEATLRCGDTLLRFVTAEPEEVALSKKHGFGPLVGGSDRMRALFERLRQLAKTELSTLILGETGTGKEVVARAIHEASPRAGKPFVVIDCASIPPSLAESTLFGHERGAFTGAESRRVSQFVEAEGGTVLLDELGELPPDVQPKLLRALAEKRIKKVGSNKYEEIDVRILAATCRDVATAMNAGTFRSDLYYRVAQVRIEVPPLRERPDDIPLLVEHVLKEIGAASAYRRVTPESLDLLQQYHWPGNVRQLRSVVGLGLAFSEDGPIHLGEHIASSQGGKQTAALPEETRTFATAKEDFERGYFGALYRDCKGNVSQMARTADMDRKAVRERLGRRKIR